MLNKISVVIKSLKRKTPIAKLHSRVIKRKIWKKKKDFSFFTTHKTDDIGDDINLNI